MKEGNFKSIEGELVSADKVPEGLLTSEQGTLLKEVEERGIDDFGDIFVLAKQIFKDNEPLEIRRIASFVDQILSDRLSEQNRVLLSTDEGPRRIVREKRDATMARLRNIPGPSVSDMPSEAPAIS